MYFHTLLVYISLSCVRTVEVPILLILLDGPAYVFPHTLGVHFAILFVPWIITLFVRASRVCLCETWEGNRLKILWRSPP